MVSDVRCDLVAMVFELNGSNKEINSHDFIYLYLSIYLYTLGTIMVRFLKYLLDWGVHNTVNFL